MDMNYGGGNVGGRGVGRMDWSGGEWDNCNSIINKYILKKIKDSTFLHNYLQHTASISWSNMVA